MVVKMKSNMELYSLGYVYHLNKIKINFLKGEKNTLLHICYLLKFFKRCSYEEFYQI